MRPSLVTPSTSFATRSPELVLDAVQGDGSIFDYVVEQGAGDRLGVELNPGQDGGHGDGVEHVGLARLAHVGAVRFDGEAGGPLDQIKIRRRRMGGDRLEQRVQGLLDRRRQLAVAKPGRFRCVLDEQ